MATHNGDKIMRTGRKTLNDFERRESARVHAITKASSDVETFDEEDEFEKETRERYERYLVRKARGDFSHPALKAQVLSTTALGELHEIERCTQQPEEFIVREENALAYFVGDVSAAQSRFWTQACPREGATDVEMMEAAFLWSTMAAVAPPMSSLQNRRANSCWAEREEVTAPCDAQGIRDSRIIRPSRKESDTAKEDPAKKNTCDDNEKDTDKRRTRPIGPRTIAFAKAIKVNPLLVLGVLEATTCGRTWQRAVSRALVVDGLGPGTLKRWSLGFSAQKGMDKPSASRASKRLKDLVHLWATSEAPEEEDTGTPMEGEAPTATGCDQAAGLDELVDYDRAYLFTRTFAASSAVCTAISEHVCPICLFQSLAGGAPKETEAHGVRGEYKD